MLPFFRSSDRSKPQQATGQTLQAIGKNLGFTGHVLVKLPPEDADARRIVFFIEPG